jgi:hypothetical protein
MSVSTHIACVTCLEALWIGQSSYIYTGDKEVMAALTEFLWKHKTYHPRKYETPTSKYHELIFTTEPYNGSFEDLDWKYWEDDKPPTEAKQ